MKKRILIDLDVVTIAKWDSDTDAINFLDRVESGEFELYVPYLIFDLLSKRKYEELSERIKHFYELHATRVITVQDSLNRIEELKIDDKKTVAELERHHVKEEDATLVVVASIFELDYLVTYNRKHLKNKSEIINEILKRNGLRTIKITLPDEI